MPRHVALVWLTFLLLSSGLRAQSTAPAAGAGSSPTAPLQVSGSLDFYAAWNANQPASQQNALYNFDDNDNALAINLAELRITRPVAHPGDLGFTAVLGYGDAETIVAASDPSGGDGLGHVLQLFGSVIAPVGNGLQVDFGKFATPLGAEVIESAANWNYSRSLLFALAIPYFHMGVRATYPFSRQFSGYAMVVNGWNEIGNANHGESYGVGGTWTPDSAISVSENYLAGPEAEAATRVHRQVTDTEATVTLSPHWAVMGNYDFGENSGGGAPARWQGAAAYVHFTWNSHWAFTPRVEWFTDPQGFATGTPQQLREITLTPEWRAGEHLAVRPEFRLDQSSKPYFVRRNGTRSREQPTVAVGWIVSF